MRPAAGVVWALALAALSLLAGAPAAQDEPPQMLYGSACGQFLPPPTLHFTGSIVPGEYGAIHVAGAPPGGFVILHIGTSNTTSSFGPLPFNLNGIAGIPSGCQLLTSGNYRIILNAKPDGTLKMGFKIPSTLGSDLYFQWAVVESAAPLSIVLTQGLHVSLMTNPAMHPVILAPDVVVDEDGNGSEAVVLDGSDSHTHEPGHVLTSWTWKEGYATLGSGPVVSATLGQGAHTVALVVTDDHVPVNTLMAVHPLAVVPATAVPGVSARYFDAGGADPATLIGAPPATADWAEVLPTLEVADGGGTIGGSPFTGGVMVQLTATVSLPAAGSWTFAASGGSSRQLWLDGTPVAGSLALAAGGHALVARFAVPTRASLPLAVTLAQGGGAAGPIAATALVHDQTVETPVINLLTPATGTTAGGNAVQIDGAFFAPASSVVVHWGGQTLTAASGLQVGSEHLAFASPPHAPGPIDVSVQTAAGTSNLVAFSYAGGGPVPVNFANTHGIGISPPTSGDWGPDGRLYVTTINGELKAVSFDDDWNITAVDTFAGVSQVPTKHSLGLAFNPYDPPSPVRVYVTHGLLYADGGGVITGPSPYRGTVSVLTGPDFDDPQPLVTGLPQSNSGHMINGLQFDDNGDLLVVQGCNTNAGVAALAMGTLPESPLSGSVVKARTSRPDFDGAVHYVRSSDGQPDDDQRDGELVELAPGAHVGAHAVGLRNPYDLVYTTTRRLYATDNGPNLGFGPASIGATTQVPDPEATDELLLVEAGNYYGSPNRSRGRFDPRQYVYRDPWMEPLPDELSQPLLTLPSSQDGIAEYRSATFGGQMQGELLLQKWQGGATRVRLTPDGRWVALVQPVLPTTGALDVVPGPGGALVVLDQFNSQLEVLTPVDSAATGTAEALDIFPWRAPASGGVPFVIGGRAFGTLASTSVTIGGLPATVTAVSATRIRGLLPAQPAPTTDLLDVSVTSAGVTTTLSGAFRYLFTPAGHEPGAWSPTGISAESVLPAPAADLAAAVLDGELVVLAPSDPATRMLDLLALGKPLGGSHWHSHAARPFVGADHAVEVLAGKLYVVGGLGGASEGRLQIYDPDADAWTTGASLPWAGGAVATAAIGGRLYAAGGLVGAGAVASAAVYDPAANAWTPLAPMPAGRHHAAGGTDGSRLFVFGGRTGPNTLSAGSDDVQVFDPGTGTWDWDKLPASPLAPLPSPRGGTGAAVAWQGELYVFGGSTTGAVLGRVDAYDPQAHAWRADASLPTPRRGSWPALFQGRVFVVGGHTTLASSPSTAFEAFTRQ
jgi:glucose/arabinose dehydrogenase/N-acetylneuraminic acid mutarotase